VRLPTRDGGHASAPLHPKKCTLGVVCRVWTLSQAFFGRSVRWSGLHSSDSTENPQNLFSSESLHFVGLRCTTFGNNCLQEDQKADHRRHSIQPVRLATYYRRQLSSIDPMRRRGRRLIIGWETSEMFGTRLQISWKALKEADLFARLACLIAWNEGVLLWGSSLWPVEVCGEHHLRKRS
jgi:hypothetical protein